MLGTVGAEELVAPGVVAGSGVEEPEADGAVVTELGAPVVLVVVHAPNARHRAPTAVSFLTLARRDAGRSG